MSLSVFPLNNNKAYTECFTRDAAFQFNSISSSIIISTFEDDRVKDIGAFEYGSSKTSAHYL